MGRAAPFMDMEYSSPIAVALEHRAGRGADGARIGEAIVSIWQDIEAALRPIIGRRGVEALYKRSLYLTVPDHPWLAGTYEENRTLPDVTSLQPIVAQQSRAAAVAAGAALLQSFFELLSGFIGIALAERLLHPVWGNLSDRPRISESSR
jgi:hypothetical protein